MAAGIATYIGNETWYQRVVMSTLRLLQPETAHSLAVTCAKHGIVPQMKTTQYESLVRWLMLHLNSLDVRLPQTHPLTH